MNKITRALEAALRHSETVLVTDLADTLNVTRGEVVTAAKALEGTGAGTFVVGRKGHPSRFVRKDAPLSALHVPAPVHQIAIRPGLAVAVPVDLTAEEAQQFIAVLEALTMPSKRKSGTYAKTG